MSGTGIAASPAPPPAAVLGADGPARAAASRLLSQAGFGLHREPRPDGVIVVLPDTREDARLRQVRTLAAAHPTASVVVLVPRNVANAGLRRLLLAGAAGIVFADDAELALAATARAAIAGQLSVPSALGRQIAPRPLSHREKQILLLLVEGLTNRQIAGRLFLAESTVKTHLSSAFRKIDARSRSEAVAKILDPDSGIALGAPTPAELSPA